MKVATVAESLWDEMARAGIGEHQDPSVPLRAILRKWKEEGSCDHWDFLIQDGELRIDIFRLGPRIRYVFQMKELTREMATVREVLES